ncbi:hypothetical protein HYV49_05120 [Candidatus Pacearchaeota archaeon]|nr:hypothetical protein [Candidatus Pacearchaeota archaeon]
MTRMYRVNFADKKYGAGWANKTVSVNGWAMEAIQKARKLLNKDLPQLKSIVIESVELLGEGE